MRSQIFAATLLVAGALAVGAQAGVIADVSFESPALNGGFYYNPSVAGVTFDGPSGPSGNGGSGIASNGSTWGFAAAPDGVQEAFIQNAAGQPNLNGEIDLSLTNLTVGAKYKATFYTAGRPGYAANPLLVTFDGTKVGSANGTSASWSQSVTQLFTASGTTGTLSFTGTAPTTGDTDIGLDNVVVSSVPEPVTWAMLIFGMGAVGTAMRRCHIGSLVAA